MRILFFAEAVTLAHVARPLALAGSLAPGQHEVVIACHPRYAGFADNGPWRRVDLNSIPPARFTAALARGAPVFDLTTLQAYAAEDRALIDRHRPDVVVGDFRLSLSVSARLAGVPYIAISNAYWCPGYTGGYALPVLPMTRFLPLAVAGALFHAARPLAFALHCRPLNRLRRQHGLSGFGNDLRRAYTDADHLLIADDPELYLVEGSPTSQTAIGSLAWSPAITPPPWWDIPVPADTTEVYVTLGSSGPRTMLSAALQALAPLPVRVIASSAGAEAPPDLPANARIAPYLPGDAAAARSRLVVCNGGSLTVQQALAVGVPVLGLASNMDQFLNMAPIEAAGAGLTLRADRATPADIRAACLALLGDPAHVAAARGLQRRMQPDPAVGAKLTALASRLVAKRAQVQK